MMDILDMNRTMDWNGQFCDILFYFLIYYFYRIVVLGTVKYPTKKTGLTNVYVDNADKRSQLLNLESRSEVP